MVPPFERKKLTLDECREQHWKRCHASLECCSIEECDAAYEKKDCDVHRLSKHSDVYIKCPYSSCEKAVQKSLLSVHMQKAHSKAAAFCTECNRIGTGSCPNCREWVYEACEKCPQRVYGTCPQAGRGRLDHVRSASNM